MAVAAEEAPPALYDHCQRIYALMLKEASGVEREGGTMIVYEGYLTQLFAKNGLSVPYYTSVMTALKRMGCTRQLRRGGGNSASQWHMIKEPTIDLFESQQEVKPKNPTKLEIANEQVLALSARVAELEEWRDSVNEFLVKKFGTETQDG